MPSGDSGPNADNVIEDTMMMHDAVVLPETGMDCDAGVLSGTSMLVLAGASGCPVGTTEEDLVTDPVVGMNACTCGMCTPTTQPSCSGMSDWTWGTSNACTPGGPMGFNFTSGQCTPEGNTIANLAAYNKWTTLSPSAGVCTAAAQPDKSKVTSTPLARCIVPANRQDILCGAQVAGGYKFCVAANDGGCQAPYTQGVIAGSDTTLGCADCACALTATGCTIEYHNDSNCTSLKLSRAADGTCAATGSVGPVSYFKVFPSGVSCQTSPGLPKLGLANATRMCCTP